MSEVLRTELTGNTPAEFRLTYRTDAPARARLEQRVFGKRILFTNRANWSTAEIVAAYRSQNDVESSFRQMKDPHIVSFGPMHHFTDQKIRVHVFYCVLALTIAHLMRRETAQAGMDMSVRELPLASHLGSCRHRAQDGLQSCTIRAEAGRHNLAHTEARWALDT
ncbi:hypothetical protein [Brooklawnia sp.]|uniref:hypothetical protein n=1 Tax=Brooklawnia sp. TaxID=2699740 RepID=UPI0031203DD4